MLLRCWDLWGWGWVGWGGMLTFLVLRTWNIAMLLRSLGSLTTWHVATLLRSLGLGLGGVGGHANVPCTSYMKYCHVAKISGIAYYVTCCYAAEMSCYTCVAGSGVMSAIMATCCRRQLPHWWITEPTKSVKKNLSIHVWCTWCLPGFVKNQYILHPFFFTKIQLSKEFGRAFYCKLQVIVTLLEANNQNARAVSHPPGCLCQGRFYHHWIGFKGNVVMLPYRL